MPTHMRIRMVRMPLVKPNGSAGSHSWQHGTLLFDLDTDPGQEHPLADDEVELRMLRLLARLMHDSDAPRSQFDRLGIPYHGPVGPEPLLVRAHAERAAATAEPLPPATELAGGALLNTPLMALLHAVAHDVAAAGSSTTSGSTSGR